jgi:TonB family protein
MRLMTVATLVLIPVLAHAQASNSTEAKPSQASATLLAKATPPAALAGSKAHTTDEGPLTVVRYETVKEQVDPLFFNQTLREGGTLSFTLYGDLKDQPNAEAVGPKLIHIESTELPKSELNVASDVTVRLTVDQHGVPQNMKIINSADAVVNERTLAAVSQYRFKPATVDNLAVPADVTIEVKIKQ